MKNEQVLEEVSKELEVIVKDDSITKQILFDKINDLINNDFQKLVSILYRMDVSEIKLKQLLNENPGTNAAIIIADLMIERQTEKIRSRQQFNKRDENISDECLDKLRRNCSMLNRTLNGASQQKLNSSNVVGEIIISSQTSGPSLSLYLLFRS